MTRDDVIGELIEFFDLIGIDGVLEHVADACEVEVGAADSEADAATWQALAEHFRAKAVEVAQLYKESDGPAPAGTVPLAPPAGEPAIWREFTEADWEAFCGASAFDDGRAPLIADVRVDGRDAQAILAGDGLYVTWWLENPSQGIMDGTARFPKETAARAAVRLTTEMTTDALRALGATIS